MIFSSSASITTYNTLSRILRVVFSFLILQDCYGSTAINQSIKGKTLGVESPEKTLLCKKNVLLLIIYPQRAGEKTLNAHKGEFLD
jgi:hypothetical protein